MSHSDAHVDYHAFAAIAPDAHASLIALGKAVDASGLNKGLTELVKLRVSQMNGCAFCTALHQGIARRVGVEDAKLELLAAWHDGGVFTEREMAALAWAEHLTRLGDTAIPDDAYAAMRKQFSETEGVFVPSRVAEIGTCIHRAARYHQLHTQLNNERRVVLAHPPEPAA